MTSMFGMNAILGAQELIQVRLAKLLVLQPQGPNQSPELVGSKPMPEASKASWSARPPLGVTGLHVFPRAPGVIKEVGQGHRAEGQVGQPLQGGV